MRTYTVYFIIKPTGRERSLELEAYTEGEARSKFEARFRNKVTRIERSK